MGEKCVSPKEKCQLFIDAKWITSFSNTSRGGSLKVNHLVQLLLKTDVAQWQSTRLVIERSLVGISLMLLSLSISLLCVFRQVPKKGQHILFSSFENCFAVLEANQA